jgi:Na+/H+ antiporter NhaC
MPSSLLSLLKAVPRLLASAPAIVFLLLLFVYLVVIGLIGLFVPALEPSATIQLVLGNYTNVTSALGASIAAGAGLTAVHELRTHRRKAHIFHEQMRAFHGLPPDPASPPQGLK